MQLSPGDKLGVYEIVAPLGAGGMGEVYRGKDTRLDREVAIKVLPAAFAQDGERLARFEREAKILASLNHPNIAQIYGVEESNGLRALVMELAPGTTLPSPLPVATALDYARQIAEALEAAHEKGITHRDLKPGNIMVTPEGAVKVLDFGLATASVREVSTTSANSPTMTMAATQAGVIIGTAAYMSPEQAAGQPLDRRSDIWSFGVVLYEMLVGKQLFAGETLSHTLADVLRAPIDLDRLPGGTPSAIRDLLRRCLNRDPRKRLRDIGDARIAIEETIGGLGKESSASGATAPPPARTGKALAVLAAALGTALAGLALVHFREAPPSAPLMRFEIAAPATNKLFKRLGSSLSMAPDGRYLAFFAVGEDNQLMIWVRALDRPEAWPLPGTSGATSAFWSPDGRFLAFRSGGSLKKIEASGGPVQVVCSAAGPFAGAAWAPDGSILFSFRNQPLMKVSAAGGEAAPLAALDLARQKESPAWFPAFLPDGRHFLYEQKALQSTQLDVYLGSLDLKPEQQMSKPLMSVSMPNAVQYAASPDPGLGYILFERDGSLMGLPFNIRRLEPAGEAVSIAQGILPGAGSYAATSTGILAYRTGANSGVDSRLLWFDRQGKQTGEVGPPAPYSNVALSPDGMLIVVDYVVKEMFGHLSVADAARGIFNRLNPGDITDYTGSAVSPDGRVAFTYAIGGAPGDIYLKPANGAGMAELLVKSANVKHPNHWSLDGRYIVYDEHTAQKQDLWILPMSGDRKPIPFLVTPADETDANFSPDGRWIAYSSDELGRREVYVQGFVPDHVPAAGVGKWRISAAGGAKPRWRRDGKELYYLTGNNELMAVPVQSTATTFQPGVPVPLFQAHTRGYVPYDVAPDGRFLFNTELQDEANPLPITLVVNWTAGLRR